MKQDCPLPSSAACGRADLVRALADGDGTLSALADLLGYAKTGRGGKSPAKTPSDPGPRPPPVEADLRPQPLLETPFWRLEAVDYRDEDVRQTLIEDDSGSTALPTWPQGPKSQPALRELAPWRDLAPRLRRTMTEQCDTREPNVPAIVNRLSRGDSLERLPRRTRRHWGQSVTVIEDRSDRLIPYWRDQSRVRAQIERLFPRYAFEHLLYWEGLSAPVPASGDRRAGRPPPPGSLVVVLGDLGLLARAGQSICRYWADLGRLLADAGCRTLVLTPAAPELYPTELSRHWQLLSWERTAGLASSDQRGAAVERLLVLLSPASRIEPGLLREVRLWVGYDAVTESVFWQHPALVSDSSVAATLDAQVARGLRQAFASDPEAVKAIKSIKRWRGGLPPEVWYAEIQSFERELRDRLIEPEDARQSSEFFAALGRRLKGLSGPAPPDGLATWFRFIELRLPDDYQADPELGQHFVRLWHLAHAHESQSPSVPGYDPAQFPTPERTPRRVMVWQQGAALCFAPGASRADSHFGGSPVARIETRNGEIQVEALALESDRNAFWKSGQPPTWADDWGTDEYGHWVTFSLTAQQGSKVTQRLRWIAPGTFLMGSPENEPERRYDDEGPQHRVTLSRGYWLFDTACTQALWQVVMGSNPSRFQGADRPVENVTWNDCQDFLRKLNERLPGLDLGLPTEAQWEYACRAGTTTPFSFGANITPEQVNYDGNYPYAGGQKGLYRQETVPVASLPPNSWGLYEMHGNVLEWCRDGQRTYQRQAETDPVGPQDGQRTYRRQAETYRRQAETDPVGPLAAGAERVFRGGSWAGYARSVRAASRRWYGPGDRDGHLGFRCVRVQVSQAGQAGAEPAGPAPGRQAEWRPAQVQPSGAVQGEQPILLRLDTAQPQARCALPQAPAFLIHTDRERFTFGRLTRPAWARAIGRDRFGLWSEIAIEPGQGEPVIQRLRWIPPGRFLMGSPENEAERYDDEMQHRVILTQGYWLADTACTQALWQVVMGDDPSRFKGEDRPVENVSWNEVQRFIERLNGLAPGSGFRLPTEAEWEYACRAETTTPFWFGDQIAPEQVNYNGNSPYAGGQKGKYRQETVDVKALPCNSWGLYQMHGNVWEWCQDWYGDYPSDTVVDPTGPAGGERRVLRGGSWFHDGRGVRSAYRIRGDPGYRNDGIGFRLARGQVAGGDQLAGKEKSEPRRAGQ